MASVHISEAEAAQDFAGLLARVRAGEEVVIEGEHNIPVAVRALGNDPNLRLLSESLRLAREHSSTARLDGTFGSDLEAVVASHPEPLSVEWD